MKAAVYVRVSTKNQEAENQLLQLRKYCSSSDWDIFEIYEDVISGKEDSRPSYDKMFRDAHKKLFDVVLFWDITRFSRSGTLFTLQKLNELEKLGICWHSYQDQYFSSLGPWKDIVISIMATIGKIERDKISDRTKAGLERAKANGKKLGRSALPGDTVAEIERLLLAGKSIRLIHKNITYKKKHGKIQHVSIGKISEIKKNLKSGVQKRGV